MPTRAPLCLPACMWVVAACNNLPPHSIQPVMPTTHDVVTRQWIWPQIHLRRGESFGTRFQNGHYVYIFQHASHENISAHHMQAGLVASRPAGASASQEHVHIQVRYQGASRPEINCTGVAFGPHGMPLNTWHVDIADNARAVSRTSPGNRRGDEHHTLSKAGGSTGCKGRLHVAQ